MELSEMTSSYLDFGEMSAMTLKYSATHTCRNVRNDVKPLAQKIAIDERALTLNYLHARTHQQIVHNVVNL